MITGKLEEMEKRFERIEADMAKPAVISNMEEYKKLAREHAELRDLVADVQGMEEDQGGARRRRRR